jgi:hypothetical protein
LNRTLSAGNTRNPPTCLLIEHSSS